MQTISLSLGALLFLLVASGVILGSTRQNAVKALLVVAIFMPLGQQVVFMGLHLYFSRILILVGLARVLMRQESRAVQWTSVDLFFLLWVGTEFLMNLIRNGLAEAFVSAMGGVYNALGLFFLIRWLVWDAAEVVDHLRFLGVACLVLAVLMIPEWRTGHNMFSVLGGVNPLSELREGKVRCQGPFRISILAGTFAATMFPLMVGLWFQGRAQRWRAGMGVLGCLFVTYASASSGPFLCLLAGLVGLGMWRMRDHMRLFRRGAVLMLVVLALVMKAPVWYLISKISDLFGGSGWHRSYLIDQAVNHFNEWWLVGTSITAHWAPSGQVLTVDSRMMDITNEFIAQGLGGGFLGLAFFVAIIVCGFKRVGRAVRAETELVLDRRLIWSFGVCLAAHCAAFVSVSYFDQVQVFWFWLLAVLPCFAKVQIPESAWERVSPSTGEGKMEIASTGANS